MSTTRDEIVSPQVITRAYVEHDGTISAEAALVPSVLPLNGVYFDGREKTFWLKAVKTAMPIVRGNFYQLAVVHSSGRLVVRDKAGAPVAGLFKMDMFAEMVEQNHVFQTNVSTEDTFDPKAKKK